MEVPGEASLYVLGCFERRVTLLSQQVRALNLVYELCATERLQQGSKLLVVGGGAAGMTVAAAAARRGCQVTLLEKTPALLPLFRSCHTRWLHPRIYDWPEEDPRLKGREPGEAGLPLLSWKAALADDVARQLERKWNALPERSNITVHLEAAPASLGTSGKTRHVTWNGKAGQAGGRFDAVVLAVGFGLEREVEGVEWVSYWGGDSLDKMLGSKKRHLISGCGDGGLVDLLRVRLKDFRHDKLEEEFLADSSLDALKQQLCAIEKEALQVERHSKNASASRELLFERYQSLQVPPELDQKIKERLRPDTEAWLNGREQLALSLQASVLHRFLVSRLLFKFGVHYEAGEIKPEKVGQRYRVQFPSGADELFDSITCRHGPRPTAMEKGFKNILEKCGALKALSALDQTRWRIWPSGYFGPEAEPGVGPVSGTPKHGPGGRPSTSAAPPFIGVPAESLGEGFKGRDAALKRLHALLGGGDVVLTGGQAGRVFAHGGGGIGKSRLAIEYAWRYRETYPGGVFFAVAKDHEPMELWAGFARELFPAEPLARDEDAALRFARWLEEPEPGRRLIILDDVQASKVAEMFERFGRRIQQGQHQLWPPPAGQVSLLVTTRMREFPKAQEHEVEQLEDMAALELLLERAERTGISGKEQEVAGDIATRLLGGHPLALSLAGAYVRRLGLSFSAYREALRQKGLTDRLVEAAKKVGYEVEDHERSIVATYELSHRQLKRDKADDALAWRALQVSSFLAPNVPIDRELLTHLLGLGTGDSTGEELGRALARLLNDLSLLDPVHEEHERVGDVKIHPLVSDYTRLSMTDEREKARLLANMVASMVQFFPDRTAGDPGWEWLSPSREAHITELWKAANALETWERWALGMHQGDLCVARGTLWRAREFYQSGLDLTQEQTKNDPGNSAWQRNLSVSLNKLGVVLVAERALDKARLAFERSLGIMEELAKKDPDNSAWQRDLSASLNKLGNVLVAERALDKARLAFERSLGIMEELAKKDPDNSAWQRDLSVSLNELGDVLMAGGALDKARLAFERSLGIVEELAKKDPGNAGWQSDVVVSCSRVASVLMKLGTEHSRARLLLERAKTILLTLRASSRLPPAQQGWIPTIEAMIRQLDEALKK